MPDSSQITETFDHDWKPGVQLPKFANRKTLANIISHYAEPIAPRSLAYHPLVAIRPGRENIYEVEAALSYFAQRLKTAPRHRQTTTRRDPREYSTAQ